MAEMPGPACFFSVQMLSYNMHLFLTFYIDLLVELCVKCLLQKAVHALCSLCWLHKWGGLKAQLLHIAPGNARGSDVALIKVSRSVRATCFMRGNAPCGVKGVMGYALSARGIFAQAQKCRMYQSRSTFPQGVALGYGQHLGLQPAPII